MARSEDAAAAGASTRPAEPAGLLAEDDSVLSRVESETTSEAGADLNIDWIVARILDGPHGNDSIRPLFTHRLLDDSAVYYRHEVFRDLEQPRVRDAAERFTARLASVRQHLDAVEKMSYRRHQEGWHLDGALVYCEAVRDFATTLGAAALESRGLRGLSEVLTDYLTSPAFVQMEADASACREALQGVRYLLHIQGPRVEVRRYEDQADYSAEVAATFERFRQGAARDHLVSYRTDPGMNHVSAQIADRVARLFPSEFAALGAFHERYLRFVDDAVVRADAELHFFLAYLDYIEPLRSVGLPFCYPVVAPRQSEVLAQETFDLALARKLAEERRKIVTNDFVLREPERVFVVSGPNQGGKTTFARTFGQLHYFAALGCPVPGAEARLLLADRVFTHFERQDDIDHLGGRLEEDLRRLQDILARATASSVVILNETFASTMLKDARFLGERTLRCLLEIGACGVYVTFVDELAAAGEGVVSMVSTVVEGRPNERTFKLVRAPANGLAYALSLAERSRLTYDQLRGRLSR